MLPSHVSRVWQAETIKLVKRPASWVLFAAAVLLGLTFTYLIPYAGYAGGGTGPTSGNRLPLFDSNGNAIPGTTDTTANARTSSEVLALVVAATMILVCWLGVWGWQGYVAMRQVVTGLDYITASLASFFIGQEAKAKESDVAGVDDIAELTRAITLWRSELRQAGFDRPPGV